MVVNPDTDSVNAEAALADPDSVYHWFRRMIGLRHAHPALVYGDYSDLEPGDERLFAYLRICGSDTFMMVLNFSRDDLVCNIPDGAQFVTGNYGDERSMLRGWEARIYRY